MTTDPRSDARLPPDVLRANFTISAAGKQGIEKIRASYEANFPDDPPAVACVAWGIVIPNEGARSEAVVVGFYQRSQLPEVEHGIQIVSGVPLIFFTIDEYHANFAGKVLDHDDERRFFLREP